MGIEEHIDIGAIRSGYDTVLHGVDRSIHIKRPTGGKDGRWWLGLYSNSTDHVANRATGKPVRVALKTD